MYGFESCTIKRLSAKELRLSNVVLEKTLKSPLDCKVIKPINSKGNQSWVFISRTVGEAETQILRPPDGKNWLIGKDHDAGKDWRQKEKGVKREWDGWMASSTRWTWVWANSGRCWRTGEPWHAAGYGVTKRWTLSESHSVVSDSLRHMDSNVHGILQARILV